MTSRTGAIWRDPVAIAVALAIAAGGCTVKLVSGVSRAQGYAGGVDVPRVKAGSRDDVPVHGHQVRVGRAGGEVISGELIAAGEDEVVVDDPGHGWVRIPVSDLSFVTIELAPGQAGPVALTSLGAMGVGITGLATMTESNSISVFFAGWGLVWVPLGLLVALPTAGVIAAIGDPLLDSRAWGRAAVVRHLYEFARFPQGEPGRMAQRPPSDSAKTPPATPPPVAAPAPPVTVPRSAAPAPAEPQPPDEPTVEPYSPERTPPAH